MGWHGITLVHWLIVALSAVPFVLIYLAYRYILLGKRFTVLQVMSRPDVFESYLKAFGLTDASATKKPKEPTDVVDDLFNLYYRWGSYALGIALNVLITITVTACIFVRAGMHLGLPPDLQGLAQKTLPTVAFAFAGAYIWNFYDLIKRYRAVDLTPASFQFAWLRLLAGCVAGPLVALGAAEGIRNIVAFGIGVLPLQTILQYFRDYATKRLGVSVERDRAAEPTLHHLQGMTKDSIERLAEEGIDSAQALAYADPMKLFLKTDKEWAVIIDLIDQALLFNYVGEKISLLRPLGIRGCVELAVIYDRLLKGRNIEDQGEVDKQTALIATLCKKLEWSIPEAHNLIRNLLEDGKVILLWQLYFGSFSNRPEDEGEGG